METCANCGHDRFWQYPDKVTCQECGATQWKLALKESNARSCAVCTKPLAGRADKRFCGSGCRQKWQRANKRIGYRQECIACKNEFESSRPATTCSPKCRKQVSRDRANASKYDVSSVPVLTVNEID